mmetsp:Transcript_7357/g.23511  ORF Transcript_7357/g.23511 Transcript_7357/m.23511 type:complete len:252 (-) Transcript_7357:244-999(-)
MSLCSTPMCGVAGPLWPHGASVHRAAQKEDVGRSRRHALTTASSDVMMPMECTPRAESALKAQNWPPLNDGMLICRPSERTDAMERSRPHAGTKCVMSADNSASSRTCGAKGATHETMSATDAITRAARCAVGTTAMVVCFVDSRPSSINSAIVSDASTPSSARSPATCTSDALGEQSDRSMRRRSGSSISSRTLAGTRSCPACLLRVGGSSDGWTKTPTSRGVRLKVRTSLGDTRIDVDGIASSGNPTPA